MRIVITGVSSFVGHHLALHFHGRGHRVTGVLSRGSDAYEGIRAERIARQRGAGVEHHTLDLEDAQAVAASVASLQPDAWIQHAAWATDYASPDYDMAMGQRLNVDALGPLFSALAAARCGGLVLTGTCAEYSSSDAAHREDEPCHPASPYGVSKLAATREAEQLAQEHALPVRVARLFFPFGPLDAPQKLIPSVLDSLQRGRPVQLTECTQQRDPVCIDDLVLGYGALVDDLASGSAFEIFNMCSGRAVPLRELLEELARAGGFSTELLHFGARPQRPGDDAVLYGSADKARQRLGWQARPLPAAVATLLDGA